MFFVYPTDDREEVIAGYALPNGTVIREHVPIRPIVVRAMAGIGAAPEEYDDILQGVLAELGLEPPPQIGAEVGGRLMKRIKRVSRAVKNTAKAVAKSKIVRSAWKAVNNPAVMSVVSFMGPVGAAAGGLMAATKIVGKIKSKGGKPDQSLDKLLASAKARGMKAAETQIRLAKRAIEGSGGNLEKAELTLQKTALKALAKSSPAAMTAIKAEIDKVKSPATARPATPDKSAISTKVYSVTAPSGKVYTFRSDET